MPKCDMCDTVGRRQSTTSSANGRHDGSRGFLVGSGEPFRDKVGVPDGVGSMCEGRGAPLRRFEATMFGISCAEGDTLGGS
jgi:hypothetical protein